MKSNDFFFFSWWKLAGKPCFCHTFFFNLSGGNYDALQPCITYLPISLASSPLSCVVLSFLSLPSCIWSFDLFRGFLCPTSKGSWGFKWSPGLPIMPQRPPRKLATRLEHGHPSACQQWSDYLGEYPMKIDDLISGSRCRLSMCVVCDNKQHRHRLPVMCEIKQVYLCALTCCNNSGPTKARLFELTRWHKYGQTEGFLYKN